MEEQKESEFDQWLYARLLGFRDLVGDLAHIEELPLFSESERADLISRVNHGLERVGRGEYEVDWEITHQMVPVSICTLIAENFKYILYFEESSVLFTREI